MKTPSYYIGKYFRIQAIDVVHDFELNYNLGVSVSYLLRAGKKTEDPREDIQKAIAHLNLELNRLDLLENDKDLRK